MRIAQLLKNKDRDVISIPPRADIATAVELLLQHGIGGLPVVDDDGSVIGFAAERDLLAALHRDPDTDEGLLIERVMRKPAPVCTPDDSVHEAMDRMTRHRLRHLVVLEGDRLTGVLSVGDIVKHRLQQLETETGVLRDIVTAQRATGGRRD